MYLKENDKEYAHPLLIKGVRFYLDRNPFSYAEEGVARHWPEKVREMSYDLAWREMINGKSEPSSEEVLMENAAKMLAPHFLADDHFLDYFQLDGGDMKRDIMEFATEEMDMI